MYVYYSSPLGSSGHVCIVLPHNGPVMYIYYLLPLGSSGHVCIVLPHSGLRCMILSLCSMIYV